MKNNTGLKRGPKPKPGTRNKLLQVGLRMIYADGYAATGIQGIVDGAEVPKASFYNHFASKEAFGAEVMDAYFDRNEGKLRDFLCNPDVAPLARLKGCMLGNFSAESADHSLLLREHLVEHFDAWSRFFENCIAEAQEQGAVSEGISATVLGRFVLNSWEGALLRMRAEKSDAPLIEFKEVIFGRLLG
jgi:TetR/AcrR family transcriptional repressor of nem operon